MWRRVVLNSGLPEYEAFALNIQKIVINNANKNAFFIHYVKKDFF